MLAQDGSAGILKADETAKELKKSFYLKRLAGTGTEPSFGPGRALRIHAECDAEGSRTRLAMQVNGRDAVDTVDASGLGQFQAAGFDVFATVPQTTVTFDNFEVREPNSH